MKDTKRTLKAVCDVIDAKKGEEILVLDVRDIASFTSFLVICHGRNHKQNQAICDAVVAELKAEERLRPSHIEGYNEASWILVDYLDFVLHVFSPEIREFYSLERLWRDGVRLELQALSA